MRKKKLFTTIASFLLLTTLTSCNFSLFDILGIFEQSSYNDTGSKEYVTYGTPKYGSNYSSSNLNNKNLGLGMGYRYLPTTGDSKILVVPIATLDYSFTSSQLTMIENAFFGDADKTGWESVVSYYEKSSFDKLRLSGEVAPVFTINKTAKAFEQETKKVTDGAAVYTADLLDKVLASLASKMDLSQYDTDKDGYIDAVWLVYAAPYQRDSELYWAFTTWAPYTKNTYDGKHACLYAWASVDFLTEYDYAGYFRKQEESADAHTFIHETGHMLGLDDYYSYDYEPSGVDKCLDTPMGGVDMMDFNIGDHCAFSKYLLDWVKPTIVTDEYLAANDYTLTLKSQTETGNCFILPIYHSSNMVYNNTAFDEYLIMEYYTPTGLNYSDSTHKYSNGLSTYSTVGVLLYHVNATVGKLVATRSGTVWDGNAYDKLPPYSSEWGTSYAYTYLYSNTKSYSWEQALDDTDMSFYRGRLISLLPATGKRINGGTFSGTNSLYRLNSTFNHESYPNFVFDDGNKPKYGFKVDSISSNDCVLKFAEF